MVDAGADDSKYLNGFSHLPHPTKNNEPLSFKVFCDPVHGQIELHPACVAIVDTPQFQRMRNIKQTGLLEYVFPGATHNRFGHSLGVCHLAHKFVQDLQEKQPELGISNTDVLCIQIAALCHDLGHGPFSHSWEIFINAKNKKNDIDLAWKHETVSINMLNYLITQNDLEPILLKYGIGQREMELIYDFITGAMPKDCDRAFLYQIVNNDDSGLDVDKWDYFLRDCHYLGLPCSFQYERLIQCSKVLKVKDKMQICFRDKVIESVYNVFRTRSQLHKLAYKHRIVTILEKMILDALLIADEKITSPSGEVLRLWEWSIAAAYGDRKQLSYALEKYSMLTDSFVFTCLRYSDNLEAKQAISIIGAIEKRSKNKSGFYQLAAHKPLSFKYDENEILDGISKFLPIANKEMIDCLSNGHSFVPVTKNDICVCVVHIDWGKGNKNPVDFVNFYSKDSLVKTKSSMDLNVATLIPQTFQEFQLQIISRCDNSNAIEVIKRAFENYWNILSMKKY